MPYFWLAVLAVILVGVVGSAILVLGPQLRDETEDTVPEEEAVDTDGLQGGADAELAAFATALGAGELASLTYSGSTPAEAASQFQEATAGLGPFTLEAAVGPAVLDGQDAASAPIDLSWTLDGPVEWNTSSQIGLLLVGEQWQVRWNPSILEPSLLPGDELVANRVSPGRGQILGRDGEVLVDDFPVVHIGIEPQRVDDLGSLIATLDELLELDPDDLAARVQAAAPDTFVEVATLRREDYDLIRDQVRPLPGTVFLDGTQSMALSETFGRALLGRSGEVTAEVIEENPGLFEAGDIAGLSGLQRTFNEALAGQPGVEISVVRAPIDPGSTTTGTGLTTTSAVRRPNQAEVLETVEPVDGESLITTIDPAIQQAAEAALASDERTSALVAIEVSTGQVLAVANGPTGSSVNFAMTGQYPPGSIFKVVTGYALLRDKLDAGSPVECPETATVQGRVFSNVEGERLGTFPFRTAFALSCNTAFIGQSVGFFDANGLRDAGAEFGIGVDYQLGEPVFSGNVPITDEAVEVAAVSFGQGELLLSPFSAAVMVATAADGVYRSPRLLLSPEPPPQVTTPLEAGPAATLRDLMRAVVTEGTGAAVAGVPGPPVSGKTGTAEFGNQNPPQSHAWFVGFQGDIAFAVFVEAGEFGGGTSAPIAARFLATLQQQGFGSGGDSGGSTTTTPADESPDDTTDPDDPGGDDSDSDDSDGGDDSDGEG